MQPIADKAEISLDFPDKTYIGAFGRDSRFGVSADAEGMLLKLAHGGEHKRLFELHIHPRLMGDMLLELAEHLAAHPIEEGEARERLQAGIAAIERALAG